MTALWRAPGVLQVGLDAPSLVLTDVPRGVADAVTLLAHPSTPDELATLLPHLGRGWIDWLLVELGTAGMLAPVAEPTANLTVVGSGSLAEAVADGLAGERSSLELMSVGNFVEVRLNGFWPRDDLVILAAASSEPDRSLTDALFRVGQPHLVVRLEPGRAVVGPFVVPGRTPCVRCLDLSRRHLDPAWPRLLAQLCLDRVEPEPTLLAWAVATAQVQVRAWLAGRTPESGGASLELELGGYRLSSRRWSAHPGCGCLVPLG